MTVALPQKILITLVQIVVDVLWHIDTFAFPRLKPVKIVVTKRLLLAGTLALSEFLVQ